MCQMGHGHGHGHGGGHGHHRGHGCCTFGGGRGHQCCCCGGMTPGCCTGGLGWRRFFSPAEELACLEQYLEDLKKEQAGVEARIRELKG